MQYSTQYDAKACNTPADPLEIQYQCQVLLHPGVKSTRVYEGAVPTGGDNLLDAKSPPPHPHPQKKVFF